jgi:hypothetical protein
MTGVDYFRRHNLAVNNQLRGRSHSLLVAGHKKDIVITNKLIRRPKQVAIYGWHRRSGKPIQPLSLVHNNKYADYSHGVRLISQVMIVGKKKYYVKDVLKNPRWSKLISYEGVIRDSRPSFVFNQFNKLTQRLGGGL